MNYLIIALVVTTLLWFLTLFVVYVLNKQIMGWRDTSKRMFFQNTELVSRVEKLENLETRLSQVERDLIPLKGLVTPEFKPSEFDVIWSRLGLIETLIGKMKEREQYPFLGYEVTTTTEKK